MFEFQQVRIDLNKVKPHLRNYKIHPQEQIERLMQSLQKHGQPRGVVVHKNTMVAGHGVREAALKLGWTTLWASRIPDEWTDEQVLSYLVADNEHAKGSRDDDELLAGLLSEIQQGEGELESVGWSDDEFEDLLATITPELEEDLDDVEFPEYDEQNTPPPQQHTCPNCGHQF